MRSTVSHTQPLMLASSAKRARRHPTKLPGRLSGLRQLWNRRPALCTAVRRSWARSPPPPAAGAWLLRRWSWAQGSPASAMRRCAAECARMGLSQFESSRALDATSVWKRERCASPPVSTSSDALAAAPAAAAAATR